MKHNYKNQLSVWQNCIGDWKNSRENKILQILNIGRDDWFWVTNLSLDRSNLNYAWTIRLSYEIFIGTGCPLSCGDHKVRTVAAF